MTTSQQLPERRDEHKPSVFIPLTETPILPITNYTLSTACPACTAPTFRLACKVRCPRCGFVWDCSEV
jgi:hypothetical protein